MQLSGSIGMKEWNVVDELAVQVYHLRVERGNPQGYEDTKNALLKAAEGLLLRIARAFVKSGKLRAGEEQEYVSLAQQAINAALDKSYDPTKGNSLVSYLWMPLNYGIPREIGEGRPVDVQPPDEGWDPPDDRDVGDQDDDRRPLTLEYYEERLLRKWGLRLDEVALVCKRIGDICKQRWEEELPELHDRLVRRLEAPDRCYDRRRIFAKGARGDLDLSELAELCNARFTSDVYNRRAVWKKHSPY